MSKQKSLLVTFLIIIGVCILGYIIFKQQDISSPPTNTKLQVTTSFYPLYFFASQIGGIKAEVRNITPSGSEPHDYEPTTLDVARIQDSNLLILNGGVEAWGDKIKANLDNTHTKIVIAGEGLLTRQLTEEGTTSQDPHVWLDPILAKQEVSKITTGFISIDPKNSTYYQTNQQKLDGQLDQLDSDYKHGLANCQDKDIITSHAAFGYLGSRYGLNQIAIAGLSPDEEPSSQQLAQITKFAKSHNIKYIFFESLVSPKLSDTIATEIGAKTLVLDPLEGISDADIQQGKNYFTVMQDNLHNLQTALNCTQ